jgi:hypothetical protein
MAGDNRNLDTGTRETVTFCRLRMLREGIEWDQKRTRWNDKSRYICSTKLDPLWVPNRSTRRWTNSEPYAYIASLIIRKGHSQRNMLILSDLQQNLSPLIISDMGPTSSSRPSPSRSPWLNNIKCPWDLVKTTYTRDFGQGKNAIEEF